MRSKAKLFFRQRSVRRNGLFADGLVWVVPRSKEFPEGFRYRLALVETESGNLLLLFDNHFPKGHHRHWPDGTETYYRFESISRLLDDYFEAIQNEETSREGKKNKD